MGSWEYFPFCFVLKESGLRNPQEAVGRAACVGKSSCDDATRVDGKCERACGARRIDRGDRPVRGAHEAVTHETCVIIEPRDRPGGIDGVRLSIHGACGIECGEAAIGSPHETVSVAARVKGLSGDGAFGVEAKGPGAA